MIRGNLLVIPVGESLLYAEPIYLQAETLKFPELKRVILVSSDAVVMEPSLQKAVSSLLGKRTTIRTKSSSDDSSSSSGISSDDFNIVIDELRNALKALQGGLGELGKAVDNLEDLTGGN